MAADTTDRLPRYLAPLPRKIETVALQYAWVIVAINVAGTAFGFWYYIPQLQLEPVVAWPVVAECLGDDDGAISPPYCAP